MLKGSLIICIKIYILSQIAQLEVVKKLLYVH